MESTETDEQKQSETDNAEKETEESGNFVQWCGLEARHGRHVTSSLRDHPVQVCPGVDDRQLLVHADEEPADDLGTYVAMFEQYRSDQKHWLGPAQLPLVFHIAKLCRKLDSNPDAPASLSSAYLQALHRLERQRPGSKEPAGSGGDLPGQGSIFDELD